MKCRWRVLATAISVLVAFSDVINAHEVEVHKMLSEHAVRVSRINEYLPSVGLNTVEDTLTDITTTMPILDWVRKGSDDEDDTVSTNFARYRHHFFDIQNGGAGYSYGIISGEPSADWGLEDLRSFGTQQYSLKSARKYLYDALTLPNKDNREMYLARTFYTLGHVIHLVQDLSQPQHVRNDSHGGGPFGTFSRYEKWTDKLRVDGKLQVYMGLGYNNNRPVVFNTARGFWAGDGKGLAEFTGYNFLSFGTNFIYWDINNPYADFSRAKYPEPKWNFATTTAQIDKLLQDDGTCRLTAPPSCQPDSPECQPAPAPVSTEPLCQLTGELVFYGTNVSDAYLGGAVEPNQMASTLSIFDQDLEPQGRRLFALNRFNFNATYPYLLPRAVAYSAGLIDFFFRGRLEINDISVVDGKLRIEVRNVSGTKNPLKNGKFELFYDSPDGMRHKLTVFDNADVGELTHESLVVLTAEKPEQALVDHLKDKPLMLVYKGIIGEEEAVASAVMEMPYSGFLVNPNYADTNGVRTQWLVYNEGGVWKALDRGNFEYGKMDWKGWYINGKPTKVITWDTRAIFQNGRLLAPTTFDVLGAALTRDADGRPYIVVISDSGQNKFVVYRRPAKRTDSDAMYDPEKAPDGWKPVYSSYTPNPKHRAPYIWWYFNGAGTEAQTLIGIETEVTEVDQYGVSTIVKKTGLDRLKYTSQGGGSIQALGNLDGLVRTVTVDHTPKTTTACGAVLYAGADLDVQIKRRGEYIVGVDYLDDKEILLKETAYEDRWEKQSASVTYTEGSTDDGKCIILTDVNKAEHSGGRLIGDKLLVDNREIVTSNSQVDSYLNTCMAEGPGAYTTIQRSRRGGGEYADENPISIDLRSKLRYSYTSKTVSGFNDTSTNGWWTTSGITTLEANWMLDSATGIPQPQKVKTEKEEWNNAGTYFRQENAAYHPCDVGTSWTAGTTRFLPRALFRTYGSPWAALVLATDAEGRVFASINKGVGSFGATAGVQFGYYRYLTDGDLLSLVPPSAGTQASDARFYPAGLVR
jgi:hypothetical protein